MNKRIVQMMSSLLALMLMASGALGVAAQDSTPAASPEAEVESENRAISLYPEETGAGTFITVELEPGESTEVRVVMGNSGNIEQTLRTYSVNALTSANGGFVLDDYESEPTGATTWVDFPEQEFTLEPGEGMSLSVTISVPDDATPGEFVTGLAAEQADPFEIPGSSMLNQRVRWSLPILVVIPGERAPAFELGDAELKWVDGGVYATIDIANTGNVTVRPTGEIRLINPEGTVVGVSQVEIGSVYTGTETVFIAGWRDAVASESYSVQIVLTAEDGTVTVEKEFTDLVPVEDGAATAVSEPLAFTSAEFTAISPDTPPSILLFEGEITNNDTPIENARVSIVTYKDGVEVDRYPIMQAVTIAQGTTPVEARYSLPGGFEDGTYTFEVTIEIGSAGTQTVLVTQPLDFEVTVGD